MKDFHIYTDGSCFGNPGPGSYAYFITDNEETEIEEVFFGGNFTTNNKMELSAVLFALKKVKELNLEGNFFIFSDSTYVINGINSWMYKWSINKWKNVKNLYLWKEVFEIRKEFNKIVFKWVKAHCGNKYNELVNKLAQDFLKRKYFKISV